MTEPLVGIVMPTYRHWDHIEWALEGLASQTMQDFVVHIVCDGCARTAELLQSIEPNVHCILHYRTTNRGPASAINLGKFEMLCSMDPKYLAWVSSDNCMHPHWLERHVDCLHRTGSSAVYSPYVRDRGAIIDGKWKSRGQSVFRLPQRPNFWEDKNCNIGPAFLYTAELWNAVGEHRGITAHDYDWWLRAEEVDGFRLERVDEPLCTYRVHAERITVRRKGENDAAHWAEQAKIRRGLISDR